MEGLTEKQIVRINRIREERASRFRSSDAPPTTRFGLPIQRSAAEAVFTNPDLLKEIGAFTNPKVEGFLVYFSGRGVVGEREIVEVGKSLKATRQSGKKSLFIGRYRVMKIPARGGMRRVFVELFWPNINSKKDNDSNKRLEQKGILDFGFPGRPHNQDIFTKPNRKRWIVFLPLNVLLKIQHPYGDFPYGEGEIDKIKKQAYFNDLDFPVLDEEKLETLMG